MKTAICIASGPSLTKEDVEYCQGKGTVYVVKECHHLAPWADAMYAADTDWWEKFNGVPEFKGRKITVSKEASEQYGLEYVEAKTQWVWSTTQGAVATGGHSGFQVMNIAELEGHDRIILLGYDLGMTAGMDKHWWEKEHPRDSRYSNYKEWIVKMNKAAEVIQAKVLNASRLTALECFDRVNLRDIL